MTNAFRIVTQTYFNSNHTINFLCGQSRCGIVRNQERVYQAHEMSVSKKRVHTNEQCFILLLEMDNASLCCKK